MIARPPHASQGTGLARRSPRALTQRERAVWFAFWLFALSVGLAVLAPFIYADGSGTCDTDGETLEVAPVTGSLVTVIATGPMAEAGALSVYTDDGETATLWGSIEEFSSPTELPVGTVAVSLVCDDPTEYLPDDADVSWTISYSDVLCVDTDTCDDSDVVRGLGVLSEQIHGLAAYLFVASGFFAFVAIVSTGLAFVSLRRG